MDPKTKYWEENEKIRWQKHAVGCPFREAALSRTFDVYIKTVSHGCRLRTHTDCKYEKCAFRHWRDYK